MIEIQKLSAINKLALSAASAAVGRGCRETNQPEKQGINHNMSIDINCVVDKIRKCFPVFKVFKPLR